MQNIILNIAYSHNELEMVDALLQGQFQNKYTIISSLESNLNHCINDLSHSALDAPVIVCNICGSEQHMDSMYTQLQSAYNNSSILFIVNSNFSFKSVFLNKYKSVYAIINTDDIISGVLLNTRNALQNWEKEIKTQKLNKRILRQTHIYNNKVLEETKRLNEIIASKNKFISIIAHDLKTSFNNLIGFSDILMTDYEKLSTDTQLRFIAKIKNLSENTYKLFKNIMTWSDAQKGKLKSSPNILNLNAIFSELITLYQPHAANKKISLVSVINNNIEVYADKNMISTLFRNLISNAIKFTPANGEIVIRARVKKHIATIEVEDNGVGIPPKYLSKIFDPDEKTSTLGTAMEEGTGLGLVLCKEMVELNGGKVSAQSVFGEGSKFIVSLPTAPVLELIHHQ